MKFIDNWLYTKVRDMWDNRHKYESNYINLKEAKMGTISIGGLQAVEKGPVEGEDTIRFELSSAIGGKILTVRRYDRKRDTHEQKTYVIPTTESLGERIAKIINLEQYSG